jgi:phosphoenolpyruvate synthase/pyruvate phosphate dikinase
MSKIDELIASSLLPNGLLKQHTLTAIGESKIPESFNIHIFSGDIINAQKLIYPYLKEKKVIDIKLVQEICADSYIDILAKCSFYEIGTKAKNIKIINEQGKCKIPRTLVIKKDFFDILVFENKISNPLSYDWSKFDISDYYKKIILNKISKEFGNKPLVIRSSATCEDSPLLSFAGQYSSFLNIRGQKKIIDAIKLCYKSLFSENAKIYALKNNIKLEDEKMAIAIQELSLVKIAGVIFTANPVNKDNQKIIVEYTKGLGDVVVSGKIKPTYQEIYKNRINSIGIDFLHKLVLDALKLEKLFNYPQDIEWGWDGRDIFIFQSRNITTFNKVPKIFEYIFKKNKVIGKGITVSSGSSLGNLKIIKNKQDYGIIKKGDIVLVKSELDVSFIKKMPLINGLIMNGGILSHMAVIVREFNIPCITQFDNSNIKKYLGKEVILDSSRGVLLLN